MRRTSITKNRLRGFIFIKDLFIKRRVEGVEILHIQPVGSQSKGFTETLVMHKLPCAQEFDRVADIRVITHAQNVVVGGACLLL